MSRWCADSGQRLYVNLVKSMFTLCAFQRFRKGNVQCFTSDLLGFVFHFFVDFMSKICQYKTNLAKIMNVHSKDLDQPELR